METSTHFRRNRRRGWLVLTAGLAGAIGSLGWWRERASRIRVLGGGPGAEYGDEILVLSPFWPGVFCAAVVAAGGVWLLLRQRTQVRSRLVAMASSVALGIVGSTWLTTFIAAASGGEWSGGRPVRGRQALVVLPEQSSFSCPDSGLRPAARYWLNAARHEASSVFTFEQLAVDLDALGAPIEMCRRARAAASDERRHADVCTQIASNLAGESVDVPNPGWQPGLHERRRSHAVLAVEALLDGVVGEGFAVHRLRIGSPTTSAGQQLMMARLAADEARHVDLARDTIEWCVATGGWQVRLALRSAAASIGSEPLIPPGLSAMDIAEREDGGFLDEEQVEDAWEQTTRTAVDWLDGLLSKRQQSGLRDGGQLISLPIGHLSDR